MKNPFRSKPIPKGRIIWAIQQSKSLTQASKLVGCSYTTFKKYAKMYDLFYENKNQEGRGIPKRRKPNKDIFEGVDFDFSEFKELLNNEPNTKNEELQDRQSDTNGLRE